MGNSPRTGGRWLVATGGAVAALLIMVGVSTAGDPVLEQIARATSDGTGQAEAKADGVVAQVGSEAISLADFVQSKQQVEANLAYMRGEVAKGSAHTMPEQVRLLEDFIRLIEEAGQEDVALGALIADRALYLRAVGEGHAATEEEVQAKVADHRRWLAEGKVPEIRAYIGSVGEERYWSELLPASLRRSLPITKMHAARFQGAALDQESTGVWTAIKREAVEGAAIELLDPQAVAPATLEGALDYLGKYWQLPSPQAQVSGGR